MKSKNLRIILIISTICIWGVIVFKIISYLKKPDVPVVSKYQQVNKPKKLHEKETFELTAKYQDPFLSKKISAEKSLENNTENKQARKNKKSNIAKRDSEERKEINWPSIKYKGQILNKNTKKLTGMLTINNKEFLVMKDIVFEEIYIDNIYRDSIRLIYQNEVKTFKKK